MAINTDNLETVLNTKIASATSSTPDKDLLIISKSVEALDNSIALKPADIGVTVQAFDATNLVDADIGVTVQAFDATNLVDADIGVTVQAYDANAATTSDVTTAVAALVDSAPGTLDTLNELAAALGDDANHVTTMTNLINAKLSPDGDGSQLTNLPVGSMGGTMTDHIIPDTNAVYDLGNAEKKIRHLFLSDNSLWVGDDHKDSTSGGKKKTKKRKQGKTPKKIVDAMVGPGKLFDTETELKNKFKVDIHDPAPDPVLDPADPTFHPPIHKWLAFSVMNGQGGFLSPSDIFDDDDDFDSENGIADVEGLENALDGKVTADANIDLLTYTEKYITIGMDGIINLSLGTVFTHDHAHATSGNMTAFTVSSVPTTGTSGFILILENGGSYPLDWWTGSGGAAIKWPAATPPTLTAAGIDIFTFTTPDSGVTWYGIPSGIGMA